MFGKFLFLALTILIGCTQPKYVQETATTEEKTPQENKTEVKAPQENRTDCSIKWPSSGHCLSWYWQEPPVGKKLGVLIFKIYRLNKVDQTPVEIDGNGVPEVVLWMPSMGHGSTPTYTEWVDVGTYRTSRVFFVMPGRWEIRFQLREGDKIAEEVKIEVSI